MNAQPTRPCEACASFARNRQTGSFQSGCIECDARHLSQSPVYEASAAAGALTETYKWALKNIVGEGGDWKALHAKVKAYAEQIKAARA